MQQIKSGELQPAVECPSEQCRKNNSKGSLHLQTRACKFIKFQEVKIQELVCLFSFVNGLTGLI